MGGVDMDTLTWETFLERFRERYLSDHFRQKQIEEFHSLHQRGLTVAQYESRFLELLPYVEYMKDERQRVHRFIMGLNFSLQGPVRLAFPTTFRQVVEIALVAEDMRTRHETWHWSQS